MSAWVLPDHIADVLPSEARHIEELRREFLDTARCHGYELVMPPLLEHLESLLTGTGEALDLQTFKLVDQLSGRMMGLRADTTQQVARIDAHLLNRKGVTRLCYCGPVLHTKPASPHATREPLQFGAEIYGHAGPEADLEVLVLALECLRAAGIANISVDLADVRVIESLLDRVDPALHGEILAALAVKDAGAVSSITQSLPADIRDQLVALPSLYGDASMLVNAEKTLAKTPEAAAVIANMRWVAGQLGDTRVTFDLADLRGYAYYSGARFSIYADGASDVLVRGGRYDEVGAVFGRNRPAAGFSLDLREIVEVAAKRELRAAIRAPWSLDAALRSAIVALREQGETVVCILPGHENEVDEFRCDRELVQSAGAWIVKPASIL